VCTDTSADLLGRGMTAVQARAGGLT
jgi:hypothetical protein